jgi:hypothetical protein
MAQYRYLAVALKTPGDEIAELPLTDVNFERRLNAAGEFSATLKLPPPTTVEARARATLWKEATDRATTCIYVLRDNTPLGGWIVWTQGYDIDTQIITIGGAELSSYARRRIVEGATLSSAVIFTNVSAMAIAQQLMTMINDIALQFDVGSEATALVTKTYLGTEDKRTADAVLELANQTDGFDFRTDVRRDAAGNLVRIWMARAFLGGSTQIVAKYGTNISSLKVHRRGDLRVNDALALGQGEETARMFSRATSTQWGPKMTSSIALGDEVTQPPLNAQAQALLSANLNHEVIEVDILASNLDAEIGSFHPGDVARLIVPPSKDPWFPNGLDTSVRTLGYRLTIPDTGGVETITMIYDEEVA